MSETEGRSVNFTLSFIITAFLCVFPLNANSSFCLLLFFVSTIFVDRVCSPENLRQTVKFASYNGFGWRINRAKPLEAWHWWRFGLLCSESPEESLSPPSRSGSYMHIYVKIFMCFVEKVCSFQLICCDWADWVGENVVGDGTESSVRALAWTWRWWWWEESFSQSGIGSWMCFFT